MSPHQCRLGLALLVATAGVSGCLRQPTAPDWAAAVSLDAELITPPGVSILVRRAMGGEVSVLLKNDTGVSMRVWIPNFCERRWLAVGGWPDRVSGSPVRDFALRSDDAVCPDIAGANAPLAASGETPIWLISDIPAGWRVVVVYRHNGRRVVVPSD